MDLSCKRLLSSFYSRSSNTCFTLQPPDSRFPERPGGSSENIVPLPAPSDPPPPPPTAPAFLSPTSTNVSSYLVTRVLFFLPPSQPPTVMILFHRTWPLPVPLFTALTRTHTRARTRQATLPALKVQPGSAIDASKSDPASVTGRRRSTAA